MSTTKSTWTQFHPDRSRLLQLANHPTEVAMGKASYTVLPTKGTVDFATAYRTILRKCPTLSTKIAHWHFSTTKDLVKVLSPKLPDGTRYRLIFNLQGN